MVRFSIRVWVMVIMHFAFTAEVQLASIPKSTTREAL